MKSFLHLSTSDLAIKDCEGNDSCDCETSGGLDPDLIIVQDEEDAKPIGEWKCKECGHGNDDLVGGVERKTCSNCGAPRPS